MDLTVHVTGFGEMFGVPNAVVDQYLKLATPSQLKILLYILRHNGQSMESHEISEALGLSDELVEEAVMFWKQTTLFQETPEHSPEQPKPKSNAQHSRAFALSRSKHTELSPLEITAALEKSDDLKTLFRMAEQQMGRPLRHIEQKALVWMHDYNNISSDIILTVMVYCKSIDKCSVSYAESILMEWWNDGLQTMPQIHQAINEMEHRRSFTGHIQKAFEMNRRPTPKQQEFIDQWQQKEIPMELIAYAYEKTLESADKLSFPYLNAVLTRWMEAGFHTRADVDANGQAAAPTPKSGGKTTTVPESDNAQAYKSFIYNIDE